MAAGLMDKILETFLSWDSQKQQEYKIFLEH